MTAGYAECQKRRHAGVHSAEFAGGSADAPARSARSPGDGPRGTGMSGNPSRTPTSSRALVRVRRGVRRAPYIPSPRPVGAVATGESPGAMVEFDDPFVDEHLSEPHGFAPSSLRWTMRVLPRMRSAIGRSGVSPASLIARAPRRDVPARLFAIPSRGRRRRGAGASAGARSPSRGRETRGRRCGR